VTCVNRYYGWYEDIGQLETIAYKLTADLTEWYQRYQRPIIITEYGADTVSGLHAVCISWLFFFFFSSSSSSFSSVIRVFIESQNSRVQ